MKISVSFELWLATVLRLPMPILIGMLVLIFWAVAWVITGFLLSKKQINALKYFNQMNSYWNVVNLVIASWALLSFGFQFDVLSNVDKFIVESKETLLLNIWFNCGYVGLGLFLVALGKYKLSKRLVGYGYSLVLQGFFLLLLDSSMYLSL